jgi:microcystin-dependent protein
VSDTFYGEIRAFPYTFAPMNWAICDGSILLIQQYSALYALLGTYYGGNGTSNFGLPNLANSVVVGVGNDPVDAFDPVLGEVGGTPSVTLTLSEIPNHTHVLQGAEAGPRVRVATPAGNLIGNVAYVPGPTGAVTQGSSFTNNAGNAVALNPATLTIFGTGQLHENRQPFQVLRYCICLYGDVYPQRP